MVWLEEPIVELVNIQAAIRPDVIINLADEENEAFERQLAARDIDREKLLLLTAAVQSAESVVDESQTISMALQREAN